MAVWQFKFALVPTMGIEYVYGKMVPVLTEYQSGKFQVLDDADCPNYWQGNEISPEFISRVEAMLPERESWSNEATMYGDEDGDSIEIWGDDFRCALDLRNFSLSILVAVLDLAKSTHCKLVLHGSGEVIEPDLVEVVQRIKDSNAYAFCLSPEDYLRNLSKSKRLDQ